MQFEHFTSSNFRIILFQLARELPLYTAADVKRSKMPLVIAAAASISILIGILNIHLLHLSFPSFLLSIKIPGEIKLIMNCSVILRIYP